MSDPILYHGEPNGPSLAVLAALFESGAVAECRRIDLLAGERHRIPDLSEPLARDMGVEGEGPVLVVDDEAMTESVFIAQYLDEMGARTLQPKDPYAHWQMLMWCRRITERCAPAAAFLGCRATAHGRLEACEDRDFDAITATIAGADLRARWKAVRAGDFPEVQITDSEAKVRDAVKMVEDQLADGRAWLMGDLTLADFETYGWLAGMRTLLPEAFGDKPLTANWMKQVAARPSVTRALTLAESSVPGQSWAPGPEINRWG